MDMGKVRHDDTIDIVIVVVEQQNVCHNFGNVNVSMEIAQLELLHCGNHFQFYGYLGILRIKYWQSKQVQFPNAAKHAVFVFSIAGFSSCSVFIDDLLDPRPDRSHPEQERLDHTP